MGKIGVLGRWLGFKHAVLFLGLLLNSKHTLILTLVYRLYLYSTSR